MFPTRFVHLLLAMLPPLGAFALQWLFWDYINPFVWFLFYPAVFLSSWLGGRVAGLLATILCVTIVWWFFIPPEHTFVKDHLGYLFPAAVFVGIGVLFSLFHGRLRSANRQAVEALAAVRSANAEIRRLLEKTRELDELKMQFFASVSHELRTPLALILGPTERLLAAPQTGEAARRDLEVVARNARTLLHHVNDLLDVSKLEASKMELEYADTDLSSLVRFVAGHFETVAEEKHIAYTVETPERLQIQLDPAKLRRVLLNLLSNAFKFTPAGGHIRLTLRREAEDVRIEVGDSGPGIPPGMREAVFERFRQLEGGTTRRFGGTGLGLAIARVFVALHGGTLAVDDAPEGGALFSVTLPATAPPGVSVRAAGEYVAATEDARQAVEELLSRPPPAVPVAQPPVAQPTDALILVVEDNPEMNRFICENLAAEYRVEAAFDGRQGLRKALELRPDLILSDMMMPELSGADLLCAVRQHPELDSTPFVLLTAKSDSELCVRVLREGAQDYLTKPFSTEELCARVRNLVAWKQADAALRASEARHRNLLENMADGYVLYQAIFDAQGVPRDYRYLEVNPAFERILGLTREAVIGKTVLEVLPHTEAYWLEVFARVATTGTAERLEQYGGTFDRHFEITTSSPGHGLVAMFFADVTARKQAEVQLRQAATVFDNTMEGILITDAECNIVAVNQAFTNITGFASEDVLGRNPRLLQSGLHDKAFYQALWQTVEHSGQWQGEIWNRRKDGEMFPAWENISVVRDGQGRITHYVAVLADISPLKQAEERLTHLAHHDSLTGLPNRLAFAAGLEQALERAKRHQQKLALLFLDLDRFKLINDTLGHTAGDKLLQVIAERLKNSVRAEDVAARLGGDEFTIILEEIAHAEAAALLAQKIIRAVAEPVHLGDRDVVTSTSIGISVYPDDADNVGDLAKAADAAMYRAKSRGRNTYEFYTRELTALAMQHLAVESNLRLALARDEFILHYQPQIEVASGNLRGVEALLRWQHPELGLILPDQFIEVAEESGIIDGIGDWVLHTACAQARRWQDSGLPPIRIAINLSGHQIIYDHTVETLRIAFDQCGLNPGDVLFELEITESMLQSGERALDTLERLRRLGISIAIDDFGTGYSSLSQLKHLPVDTLKIDRSFMRNVPNDTDNKTIISAIVSLGHSLGLRVIAEGLETPAQLAFLVELGCDEAQGFLISEAVPPERIAALLEQAPHVPVTLGG